MTYWEDESSDAPREIIFEGQPKEPDKSGERSLWATFKETFARLARGKFGFSVGTGGFSVEGELEKEDATEKESAEVGRIKAEAEKLSAEAAEIQAGLDEDAVEKAVLINEELRRIFTDDETPDEVKILELLNIIQAEPGLADQLEKIQSLSEKLGALRGVQISLPASEKEDKTDVTDPEQGR